MKYRSGLIHTDAVIRLRNAGATIYNARLCRVDGKLDDMPFSFVPDKCGLFDAVAIDAFIEASKEDGRA